MAVQVEPPPPRPYPSLFRRKGGEIKDEDNLCIATVNQFTRRRRNSSRKKGGNLMDNARQEIFGRPRGKVQRDTDIYPAYRRHGYIMKEIADYSGIHYTGGSREVANIVLSKN